MTASKLHRRAIFEERSDVEDLNGNTKGEFQHKFTVWAGISFLRGSEQVLEARQESRRPVIISVRKSSDTELIKPHWRVTIDGVEYNIRELPSIDRTGALLEFLAESGVPSG